MTLLEQWARIPEELRNVPKWCIAAPDKSPYTVNGHRASVTNPVHWFDFYSATLVANNWGNGSGIGFVLGEEDQFTCIDLDIKDEDNEPDPSKRTTPEQLQRYWKMVQAFNSYTEYSRSGKGLHIWIKGKVGLGCRRDGVEVYSQQRFIICTGNPLPGFERPVEERQELLDLLVTEIRSAATAQTIELEEQGETLTDAQVWERAVNANNAEKFIVLFNATSCVENGTDKIHGSYTELGYPTQSEADLSLLSMLCFYSNSNEQVRRMFRLSGLGKRPKAAKNNRYINRTLSIIRGRQQRENQQIEFARASVLELVARATPPQPQTVQKPTVLTWPPGLIGELAQWFYSIAPRPVREVAIVSALGVAAGLYGRAYNISGSGLNLYIVLVARSAVGKEAMHSSISKLIHTIMNSGAPAFSTFVDFNDYASGPALLKAITASESGSFVNVAGEWGRKLRKMGDDHSEGAMSSLRTVMTNLYQKSSAGTIVGGIGYSDKDKNVASVNGVAYSMIGETTPDTFYESLTNTMMQDGFMSRFIVIEYAGLRPEFNTATSAPIPENVFYGLVNGAQQVLQIQDGWCDVALSREAQSMLDAFDKECDGEINKTDDESWRQMWNRAHLKSLKVAGLLAVADNFMSPVVTKEHAEWALNLVRRDIQVMGRKIEVGDIGEGDTTRERKMLSALIDYLKSPVPDGYRVPDEMRQAGVVARKYLQIRLQHTNTFRKHKLGQSIALDSTIRSLVDSGYLIELSKDKVPVEWGFTGKCYRIMSLPDIK